MALFFFNDTATTEIYTLSLHDALPICELHPLALELEARACRLLVHLGARGADRRSEEHTSELQSLRHLVCRLLLEKKKTLQLPVRAGSGGESLSSRRQAAYMFCECERG